MFIYSLNQYESFEPIQLYHRCFVIAGAIGQTRTEKESSWSQKKSSFWRGNKQPNKLLMLYLILYKNFPETLFGGLLDFTLKKLQM